MVGILAAGENSAICANPLPACNQRVCDLRECRLRDACGGGNIAAMAKANEPKCADCFFRQNMLCALQREEPCSTFRPAGPAGLVPPQQPALLMRSRRRAAAPQALARAVA
jgi:hypothetical protein